MKTIKTQILQHTISQLNNIIQILRKGRIEVMSILKENSGTNTVKSNQAMSIVKKKLITKC